MMRVRFIRLAWRNWLITGYLLTVTTAMVIAWMR